MRGSVSGVVQEQPARRAAGDRRARRREATRASLIGAARRLFAAQGVEATRINEITEEADVGFGSFYNHFDSKDAIVQAVLSEAVAAQGAAIGALTADVEDPAEVVCAAHRYFVGLARSDPDWAWLLVRLDVSHNVLLDALGPLARRDLARGVEVGRFDVADQETALLASGGALLGVMRAVLDGEGPPDADRYHAEGILRAFGLSPADAAEVAARPAPVTG
ncbi:MAG TPA: TetR/AcrR family transcriptional regulator [Solirubrobacteraceae bacterium]|nr:TetR/AcrR family transcriptional regulator [Solirubrobacteraceae bacterium]